MLDMLKTDVLSKVILKILFQRSYSIKQKPEKRLENKKVEKKENRSRYMCYKMDWCDTSIYI